VFSLQVVAAEIGQAEVVVDLGGEFFATLLPCESGGHDLGGVVVGVDGGAVLAQLVESNALVEAGFDSVRFRGI